MSRPCRPATATQEKSAEPGVKVEVPHLLQQEREKGWGAQQFREKKR